MMAQSRRVTTTSNRTARTTGSYVYGNAARKLDVRKEMQQAPKRQLSRQAQSNRERARFMSVGYAMFLAVALCATGMFLVNYIKLQAEMTNKVKQVSQLERQLNNLKLTNDENYNRIISSVDMEEVKRVAIGELGMTYAKEGQIINYTNIGNDYMRKVTVD